MGVATLGGVRTKAYRKTNKATHAKCFQTIQIRPLHGHILILGKLSRQKLIIRDTKNKNKLKFIISVVISPQITFAMPIAHTMFTHWFSWS